MSAMPPILYLSRADVEGLGLGMSEIIGVVEEAFVEKGRGNVEMPPKPGIHPRPDAFIHAMPAYVRSQEAAGMKWISGYPANMGRGLPYISGLMLLNDADTGFPTAVMDATWLTAMRTGAATAVAARHLARRDASTAAILGLGVQGRTNLEALNVVQPGLRRVYAYDVREAAAARFAEEARARHGLEVEICATPEAAVRPAELIVTAGPILRDPSPAIGADWLAPGSFTCALDFDSYVRPDALRAADAFVTDDVGQLRYYKEDGYFRDIPENPVDLGDVVAGKHPGRRGDAERTIAVNLGIALEDVATGQLIYRRARERGVGSWLEA